MNWVKRSLVAALGAALAAAAVAGLWPRPEAVEVGVVTRGPFEQSLVEDGVTRTRERYVVSAPLAGVVERLRLKAGDRVQKGDLLAVILANAPPLLDARSEKELQERLGAALGARQRASAAKARASVALAHAKSELDRVRRLAAGGLATRQDVEHGVVAADLAARENDVARYDEEIAAHEVEVAQASLRRWQQIGRGGRAAQRWEVRSPVPGRVLRVVQESAGAVNPGTPLLELANLDELEVVADLLTADAVQLRPGGAARIVFREGSEPLAGRLRLVEPAAFTKVSALGVEEQRVNAVVDLVDPRESWNQLGDGYRVDVHFVLSQRVDAVKVPAGALFRDQGGWAVFTITGGRAQRRRLDGVLRSGVEAMVGRGLQPGESVILFPGDRVKDGVRVRPR